MIFEMLICSDIVKGGDECINILLQHRPWHAMYEHLLNGLLIPTTGLEAPNSDRTSSRAAQEDRASSEF